MAWAVTRRPARTSWKSCNTACSREGERTMAIEVRPLHQHFGAEVIGADLASCNAALMAEFEAAIGQHGLLMVRGAPLDDEGLTRFGGLFGPLQNLSAKRDVRSPIAPITNLADDGKLLPKDDGMRRQNDANGLWHI